MPTATTISMANLLAKNFISYITTQNSLYFFAGRQIPWEDEYNPPIVSDSVNNFKTIWDYMFGAQLVTFGNLSLVIPRVNWTANQNYTAYTDTNPNLANTQFYVLNSNNEIYKCLSNNYGDISTVEPVGLGTVANNYIQTLSDGYAWKYMYNIDIGDIFINLSYIPVPITAPVGSSQALIQSSATPGSIDIVNVKDGGSNYIDSSNAYIVTITGDGTGANAYANISGGVVQNIIMVDRGSGYSYANVTVNDTFGDGANLIPIMSPQDGHGAHTDLELAAKTLMISVSLISNVNGYFTTSAAIRQAGLILNPYLYNSNTISTILEANTTSRFVVTSGVGTFTTGEQVYQGISPGTATFTGTVLDFDSNVNVLRVNNVTGIPAISSIVYGVSSGAQRYIIDIANPDLQRYTGILLDQINQVPIPRSINQRENFRFILSF